MISLAFASFHTIRKYGFAALAMFSQRSQYMVSQAFATFSLSNLSQIDFRKDSQQCKNHDSSQGFTLAMGTLLMYLRLSIIADCRADSRTARPTVPSLSPLLVRKRKRHQLF